MPYYHTKPFDTQRTKIIPRNMSKAAMFSLNLVILICPKGHNKSKEQNCEQNTAGN